MTTIHIVLYCYGEEKYLEKAFRIREAARRYIQEHPTSVGYYRIDEVEYE